MKSRAFNGNRCFIKFFILIFILASCSSGEYLDERFGYTEQLPLGKPNPHEESAPFAKLIGSWVCVSRDVVDSTWYDNKAAWKWEYILGGHAVLNHWWQEDNSPKAPTQEYFANGIFIRNKDTNHWEAVIVNSRPHKLSPRFQLDLKGNEIHMSDGTGKWLVTFYDITEDSFEWKYEVLNKEGIWTPISEISAVKTNENSKS